MAYRIRTKNQRARLKDRREAYFEESARGAPQIGYRKCNGNRKWLVRWRDPLTSRYRYATLGPTDEIPAGLTYVEAMSMSQDAIRERDAASQFTGRLTVRSAVKAYLDDYETRAASTATAQNHFDLYVLPDFGDRLVSELRRDELRSWRNQLAKQPPRARKRTFAKEPAFRSVDMTCPEQQRKRKASVNRIATSFRAMLNHTADLNELPNTSAWRYGLKAFPNVDAERSAWLNYAQAQRLLNACEGGFRNLVAAALITGCRYGELTRLEVRHFSPESRAVHIARSKSGKSRDVILSPAGVEFFDRITEGKRPRQLLLITNKGEAWKTSEQARPMRRAVERAGLDSISFHGLRHSYASQMAAEGMPLQVLQQNLGHADLRQIVKRYAHLSDAYRREQVEKAASNAAYKIDFDDAHISPIERRVRDLGADAVL